MQNYNEAIRQIGKEHENFEKIIIKSKKKSLMQERKKKKNS